MSAALGAIGNTFYEYDATGRLNYKVVAVNIVE